MSNPFIPFVNNTMIVVYGDFLSQEMYDFIHSKDASLRNINELVVRILNSPDNALREESSSYEYLDIDEIQERAKNTKYILQSLKASWLEELVTLLREAFDGKEVVILWSQL